MAGKPFFMPNIVEEENRWNESLVDAYACTLKGQERVRREGPLVEEPRSHRKKGPSQRPPKAAAGGLPKRECRV